MTAWFDDPTLRTVAAGTAALGAVAGAVGTFAVIRRQSLQGDAISHAALPGVMAAFFFGARSPLGLAVGAAVTGWLAMVLVGAITRRSRVPFDAALAGALAVFFGVGLAAMSYMQRHVPETGTFGPERYLFGQAALLRADDVAVIVGFGAVAAVALGLFWKELKLVSFDPDFAASTGLPTWRVDVLLTTLIVAATVVGLQAVGVVLMSALIVAPAVAARQWSDRLGRVVMLAAGIGAAAGFGGTLLSHGLSGRGRAVPTGPTIVLCATAAVVFSLALAPQARRRLSSGFSSD
ncbi:MAG: metal ABC transporter permease [Fimbriiglobus sp.]